LIVPVTQTIVNYNLLIIIDIIIFISGYNLMKIYAGAISPPPEDAIALKKNYQGVSIKEAMQKAVYYYLKEGVSNKQ